MPRKKVDGRVRVLIDNAVRTKTRAFFVLVGDRGKDQVVNLHYILSKAQVKARPSVLWCYNKELGFSTHRQKRMKQIKKMAARGLLDADKEDPLEMFISSTHIRWCYYKETNRILGNTYGMAVLQDFEAITPNILCRTIETVEGGGIVVLLLNSMSSLKQLYTLTMDVHERFRSEARHDVVGRFNERFILSLASCQSCLVLDDELNVLPISKHAKHIVPVGVGAGDDEDVPEGPVERVETEADKELSELKSSLAGTELVGALTGLTRTIDQAKAVLTFAEAIAEKTLRSTVALTAGRGRGKSAALGLAIAAAVGYGYSNIFVTSPSPENLSTLFEFVFKGLESLAFKEHVDYEAVASTNPDFNRAIVRVNVFRGHRQTVQYIEPHDAAKLSQAELLVIDEAAAIPLPLVKALLGPYLVFLASTVNGYEGTGRSLSLKLIQQLRMQQAASASATATLTATGAIAAVGGAAAAAAASSGGAAADPWAAAARADRRVALTTTAASGAMPGAAGSIGGRTLREVTLSTPIRYAENDAIEKWLNDLLCLDATTPYRLGGRLPAPSECELFAVDRDALFSYHKLSEAFLHRMMSLYVSSHYKNSPNDLQLMSDAPSHKLFVLLGPTDAGRSSDASDPAGGLPDILCVLQVCLEGDITKDAVRAALARGARGSGDLIPWALSQQFQDDGFASLSGARVVRIATHPDATKMGYGTRALDLLTKYFQGDLIPVLEDADDADDDWVGGVDRGLHRKSTEDGDKAAEGDSGLTHEKIRPRKQLPPLLLNVHDIKRPERLHWIGVSYGLTLQLFNFWKRAGYLPVYLRQTANDLTAEHTMIMLRALSAGALKPGSRAPKEGWSYAFVADFARRYMQLLSFEFRSFDPTLALTVMDAACSALPAPPTVEGAATAGDDADEDGPRGAASAPSAPSLSGEISKALTPAELSFLFSPHDLKRLEAYARSTVDYHLVLDLLPDLARLFFQNRVANARLPRLQSGILMGVGLQRLSIEAIADHFGIAVNQVLALFNKAIRKITTSLVHVQEKAAEAKLDRVFAASKEAASASLRKPAPPASAKASKPAAALPKAATEVIMADPELRQYALPQDDEAWKEALNGADDDVPDVVKVKRAAGAAEAVHAGDKRRASTGAGKTSFKDGEVYDPRGHLSSGKVKKARAAK